MGRAWRIEYEGELYHVLSRGNERKDIFHDDWDRLMFLDVVGEMSGNYDVDIFAYGVIGDVHQGNWGRSSIYKLTSALKDIRRGIS